MNVITLDVVSGVPRFVFLFAVYDRVISLFSLPDFSCVLLYHLICD